MFYIALNRYVCYNAYMRLLNYLTDAPYGEQQAIANAIGATKSDLSNWKHGKLSVPVKYCVAIERATKGAVTRRDLRPNDWADIWPELAETLTGEDQR